MKEPVLVAHDAEDLEILSARLQDAVAKLGDLAYHARKRSFTALFNRYKWEAKERVRVRAGLVFAGVLSVQAQSLRRGAPEAVVELLAIRFTPRAEGDPAGTVELLFAGGGTIRIEVECLEASLIDDEGEWAARGRPSHQIEG